MKDPVGNTRCLEGIDSEVFRDFGRPAHPGAWREVEPGDIRSALNNENPHIHFISPPCRGASSLLRGSAPVNKKVAQ